MNSGILPPIHIVSFYKQDMEYADPDNVYETWMKFNDAIKGIDSALDNWFYLAKATPKEAVYFDIHSDREKIISNRILSSEYKRKLLRSSITGEIFRAWSRKIPAEGPANTREEEIVSFSSLTGGTNNRPALFHLETGALQDAKKENEMEAFAKICTAISNVQKPIWLSACPLSYMKHRVFPHRRHVGWMAVVPDVDISGQLPFLAYDEYLPDVGTLIVTTEERFDTTKPEHVEKSQMTETTLLQMGLLPERQR
ncbi:immunity 52 family protein [Halomonas denitrificans]|uniref:Imm52 family immunity protein n=1 Tax=Halomonas denitrificans TaxID=370769 RepID=UPI001CD4515F|nr:Imm52 family immunity protein [Halomonas denitrificans]MCA0973660.1 immunity 52 family protein [Halomonas denitrificans]